jgi:two-component system nitrogen regulation sensor histidine kinase NtrY
MMTGFRTRIVIRVMLIVSIACALAYVLVNTRWLFAPIMLSIVLVTLVINLISYIEKTNRSLTSFLLQVRNKEYNTAVRQNRAGASFTALSKAFNDVLKEFERVEFQREAHYQYLQVLTENIGVGIISAEADGRIHLINPEAKKLLQIATLHRLSELRSIHPKLEATITSLKPGERQVIPVVLNNNEMALSVQVRHLRINESNYQVILFQDINRELEDKEEEAWQRLIRVLTHEIMNSVTPIVTLSEAVNQMLREPGGSHKNIHRLGPDDLEDVYGSLDTIESRSKGLLRFVNAYKSISQTPEVVMQKTDLPELLNSINRLMRNQAAEKQIKLEILVEPGTILADRTLLEQVMINLVRNAIDALEPNGEGVIRIAAQRDAGKAIIQISDNGPGIDAEILSKVFVPFFTTKKTGTGVGLSLSRQIMKLMQGNLRLTSEPGKGTMVTLELQTA